MRLLNPSYLSPVDVFINQHQANIQLYFENNANLEFIDFDQVRADFSGQAEQLTDNVIMQICKNLGISVFE